MGSIKQMYVGCFILKLKGNGCLSYFSFPALPPSYHPALAGDLSSIENQPKRAHGRNCLTIKLPALPSAGERKAHILWQSRHRSDPICSQEGGYVRTEAGERGISGRKGHFANKGQMAESFAAEK